MGPEAPSLQEPVREDHGPEDRIVREDEVIQASASRDAKGGDRPHEGGRREAEDPVVRTDQRARSKKSNSRDDAAEEGERVLLLKVDRQDGKSARAGGHEDEGPQAHGLPPELPFEPDAERQQE